MIHSPSRQPLAWPYKTFALLGILIAVGMILNLLIGSRGLSLAEVWQALTAFDAENGAHVVIWTLRLPRGLLALTAGAALGVSGALMQAITRNPLAEPGLLGVNAGAAVAVVLGSSFFALSHISQYIWLAWGGAGLAGIAVFLLGGAHRGENDPLRLVLAGAGMSILLGACSGLVILNSDLALLDLFRHWASGALQNRSWDAALAMSLALLGGLALALPLTPALNGMALGHEMGAALGVKLGRIWALSCIAVLILAGSATATAGPIVFLGLIAGHLSRRCFGADWRLVLPGAGAIGAILLLLADILGRIVAAPDEVAAGVMTSLLGAVIFVQVLRKMKLGVR